MSAPVSGFEALPSAACGPLLALRSPLFLERLRRLLLGLFLAIHTFAHDVALHTADRSAVGKDTPKEIADASVPRVSARGALTEQPIHGSLGGGLLDVLATRA
jgi:hypothetical protein